MATELPDTIPGKPVVRPAERPETTPHEQTRPRQQPPYAVVLHNDDVNGFDFVVGVLCKVFHYGALKAFWLTLKAHVTGKSVVWSGSLEVAELKAEQIRSCGPDPNMKSRGAQPLRVSVEPLPG
jgi:ATP-dependent Clp protease adaptor protein ClpS